MTMQLWSCLVSLVVEKCGKIIWGNAGTKRLTETSREGAKGLLTSFRGLAVFPNF